MDELIRELYERYRNELCGYLFGLCRNAALAEDLVEETFLRALLSLPDCGDNLRAWLYRVARNLYYDYLRQENRQVSAELCRDLPRGGLSLIEQLVGEEELSFLERALGRLSRQRLEIVRLYYYGRLSHREIASLLNLSEAAVRVQCCRAKKELKEYMEEYYGDTER